MRLKDVRAAACKPEKAVAPREPQCIHRGPPTPLAAAAAHYLVRPSVVSHHIEEWAVLAAVVDELVGRLQDAAPLAGTDTTHIVRDRRLGKVGDVLWHFLLAGRIIHVAAHCPC